MNALACLALEKFGYRFITSSLEVVAKLKSVSKLLVLSVLPHTLMLALEGMYKIHTCVCSSILVISIYNKYMYIFYVYVYIYLYLLIRIRKGMCKI